MRPRIYFAGPDVFRVDYASHVAQIDETCERLGALAIHPADGKGKSSREIFEGNVQRIRGCHAIVAHVDPFRSRTEPDSGTCFEIGMAFGLGKPISLWMSPDEHLPHEERCRRAYGLREGARGMPVDCVFGFLVENFESPLNLMLAHAGFLAASLEEAVRDAIKTVGQSSKGR